MQGEHRLHQGAATTSMQSEHILHLGRQWTACRMETSFASSCKGQYSGWNQAASGAAKLTVCRLDTKRVRSSNGSMQVGHKSHQEKQCKILIMSTDRVRSRKGENAGGHNLSVAPVLNCQTHEVPLAPPTFERGPAAHWLLHILTICYYRLCISNIVLDSSVDLH